MFNTVRNAFEELSSEFVPGTRTHTVSPKPTPPAAGTCHDYCTGAYRPDNNAGYGFKADGTEGHGAPIQIPADVYGHVKQPGAAGNTWKLPKIWGR